MKKRVYLIVLASVVVLTAAAAVVYKVTSREPVKKDSSYYMNVPSEKTVEEPIEETPILIPTDSTILAVVQKLKSLTVKTGQEEYYKKVLEHLTREIWFISDTTAVQMEIVQKKVWDTLKGTNVAMHFDVTDLTNVTIKDSSLILRPPQGEPLEYTSFQIGDAYGSDIDNYEVQRYEYCGRDATTNQWEVYYTSVSGTAGDSEYLYIDCQTGKVNCKLYGEAVISPNKSLWCEFYQNYHDGDNYIAICPAKGEGRYGIDMYSDDGYIIAGNHGQWINDSTLKIKVEYSDMFNGYDLFEDSDAELVFNSYAPALFYRILHITPFRADKPKETGRY